MKKLLKMCYFNVVKIKFLAFNKLEGKNRIYFSSKLKNCTIGFGTYICKENEFVNTKIGRYCSIGSRIKLITGQHPSRNYISTHPAFFSTKKQQGFSYVIENIFIENKLINGKSLIIGNDVWIGSDVKILEGVKIGDGAIIAAASLVTKDIPPYSIVAGVPAKVIRYRFSLEEIEKLLNISWWNLSEIEILKLSRTFDNSKDFFHLFESKRSEIQNI